MNDMNIIRVPRAREGLEPLVLEMTDIRQAEGRLGEVAITNANRAPELLALFNGAYLITSRYINFLEYELDVAERRLAETRAIFLIDKLPTLLAEKGLATARSPLGSEDIRQAFLDREPEFQPIHELISTYQAYIGLLETQQTGFENAYNSVKKLLGNDGHGQRPNPYLPQPLYDQEVTSIPRDSMSPNGYQPPHHQAPAEDDFFGNPNAK